MIDWHFGKGNFNYIYKLKKKKKTGNILLFPNIICMPDDKLSKNYTKTNTNLNLLLVFYRNTGKE